MAILDNKLKKDYEHKKGIVISKTRIDTGSNIYRGPFYLEENLPKVNSLSVVKNINADKTNTTVWYKENFKETIQDSYTGTVNSINCLTIDYSSLQVYDYHYCIYIDPHTLLSCLNALYYVRCSWLGEDCSLIDPRLTAEDYSYCVREYCNYSYWFYYTTYTYNITNNCGGYVS